MVEHHERLIEDLEVWLFENRLWFKDIKQRGEVFYFDKEGGEIAVPENLNDICHHLQKNK